MLDYLLYHVPHFTMAGLISGAFSVVGFCSFVSIFLAVFERWAQQWFPNSRGAFAISALNDLVTKFGALNLRDAIAPKVWSGVDRRDATPPVAKP